MKIMEGLSKCLDNVDINKQIKNVWNKMGPLITHVDDDELNY